MADGLEKNLSNISFTNTNKLREYFDLVDITDFYQEEIFKWEEVYHSECEINKKLIVKNLIYQNYFEYCFGNIEIYKLLKDFSDVGDGILAAYFTNIEKVVNIMNNFEFYYS